MGLKVWLPLDGNIENKGSSNATVTNYGATVSTAGKTGSCYSFDGTNDYMEFSNLDLGDLSQMTICFWVSSSNGSINSVLTMLNSTGYVQFRLFDGSLSFRDTNHSSVTSFAVTQPSVDTWTHYAIVYSEGDWYIYKDGILTDSKTYSATAKLNTNIKRFQFGRYKTSSYDRFYSGKINDFRIYDHCLSAKEVKELSQALILHYKMTGTQNAISASASISNAFNYPTFNTATSTGGWSHWAPQGASGTYSQNTNKQYIFNRSNTYSHLVKHTSGSYYIVYQSPAFEGGYRSVQAIIKMADGSAPNRNNVYFSWNANTGTIPSTTYTYLRDGFYLMKCEGFQQTGSNDLVSIVLLKNSSVYISEAYLENNKQTCTNIIEFSYNTDMCDVSGYRREGTISGSISEEYDSPRYQTCSVFDGNDYIVVPKLVKVKDSISICMWAYMSNWSNYASRLISCTETGGWNFEPSSGKMSFVMGTGTSSNTYKSVVSATTLAQLGSGWHHFAGTYDGFVTKIYIDGVLNAKNDAYTTKTPIFYNPKNGVFIGAEAQTSETVPSASTVKFSGKMSDVRIYATALSDSEILDLYNSPVYIDNLGTMGAFEFVENSENGQSIEKTGIVGVKNLIEYSDNLKLMPDGSVFLRLLRHNNPASKLFTEDNCWLNSSDPDLYSSLVVLKTVEWMRNLNTYEFLACEKLTSNGTENQYCWKQSNNPATTSLANGFQLVSGTAQYLTAGLANAGTHGCFDINGANWWCCCGCYEAYQGGIPGFNGVVTTGYIELYIRIPDEMIKGYISGDTKFFNQSIISNKFKEI